MELNKGAAAPYSGIFMPEDHFRYLMTREFEADQLTNYIADPENKFSESSTPWLLFLGFFVTGLATGIVLHR